MAVDAVTSAQSAAASAPSPALGRARLAENFDTFLSLLTTQMKNQDPLSPMDSNAFTQQIVQMTGVEQQLMTNELLQKLVANSSGGLSTAVAMIGKQVRAVTDMAGLEGGKANWAYRLDVPAANVTVEVLDSTGRVVRTVSGQPAAAGEHPFTWDGKDAGGNQLADGGTYTLRVTATDSTGSALAPTIYSLGVVSGVEQNDGQTFLTINGAKIPWEVVSGISNVPAPASTAQSSATNNNNNNNNNPTGPAPAGTAA